jgi:hypothetical protein
MKTLILASMLLFSSFAHADIYKSVLVQLDTIYLTRDYTDAGGTFQDKITDTDFRLMRVEKQWAYGVMYSLSANDSSNANRSSYGLSLGFYSEKDFYLNYTYFYSSKYSFGGTEYKGNGYEIDLGFLSKVTSSFYVGLMFAIKNFSYSDSVTNGVSTSISATQKEVMPMFTFAVDFM